jgi:DNA-binding MarR family transcriptional regulator
MRESSDAIDEIARECLAMRVRMLGRAISALYDRAIGQHGVTIAQVTLLVFIAKAGPCAPARICRALHMERSTVSRNLEALVARGWLAAATSDAGRVREVSVTPSGRQLIETVLPDWRTAQREAAALLGDSGVRSVRSLAETLWEDPKVGR